MLLNKMTSLRISVSSLRWLALVIYCLSLTIPQDGGRYNYVYCAWVDYRYIFLLLLGFFSECRHEVTSNGEIG